MPRVQWRTFDKGLWLAGGRDNVPDGALRRCSGVSQLREGAIRAARGSRQVNFFGANQYVRFADAIFQCNGADVLREGAVINASFPQSGVLGVSGTARVSFLRAGPQFDQADWLFVAGGNNPFKVKADGTSASKWGIDAPADGMQGAPQDANVKIIDSCDSAATWTVIDAGSVTPTDELTIAIGGATSMRFDFTVAGQKRYSKAVTTNLNHFGTGLTGLISADQDYIEIWVRFAGTTANGEPAAQNFEALEIAFGLGAANFDDNVFTRRVDSQDGVVPQAGLLDQQLGVSSVRGDASETDIVEGNGAFNDGSDTRTLLNQLSQTVLYRQNDVWQRLRLPKITFDRVGSNTTLNWKDVQAIRLTFIVNGGVSVLVDQIEMVGGWGLVGKYQYQQTFKNSVTGSRSNPNPTPLLIQRVDRQRVILGNIQQSTDPQVDTIEIWRTVGNGAGLFLAAELDAGTTTYEDEIVDFRGLFTGTGYLTADQLPDVLQSRALELDNDPPPATITEVLGTLHVGRAWWLDSAADQRGRLFYSPSGRPESNAGFVEVTNTDNPLITVVRWNDVLYVFSERRIFRIVGEDEPFVSQEVFGAPGTTEPDTVIATPFGICYQAADGVRVFDGSFSLPVSQDALGPTFRGYTVEGVPPFGGITATYYREDYWLSNGDDTLVYNLRTQAWRHYLYAFQTLHAEDDTQLLASVGVATGLTFSLEDDAPDTATSFVLQTPSYRFAIDTLGLVQRVLIELEAGDLTVVPTLVLEDSEIVLAGIVAPARTTLELARLDSSRLVGVRLTASVTDETLIVYGIEADCYRPEGTGSEQ